MQIEKTGVEEDEDVKILDIWTKQLQRGCHHVWNLFRYILRIPTEIESGFYKRWRCKMIEQVRSLQMREKSLKSEFRKVTNQNRALEKQAELQSQIKSLTTTIKEKDAALSEQDKKLAHLLKTNEELQSQSH